MFYSFSCVRYKNKENLLFLQNRLPSTFNIMFYCFLLLHLSYCYFCFLFSVSTIFCIYCFLSLTFHLFPCFFVSKLLKGNWLTPEIEVRLGYVGVRTAAYSVNL